MTPTRRDFLALAGKAAAVAAVVRLVPFPTDLQGMIDATPDHATLRVPTGTYRLHQDVSLRGRHGIYIDFQGSTIVSHEHACFKSDECSGLTFANGIFTSDEDQPVLLPYRRTL